MSGVTKEWVKTQREAVTAALGNEMLTRTRVEALEKQAEQLREVIGRGFLGRLRWIFLGR